MHNRLLASAGLVAMAIAAHAPAHGQTAADQPAANTGGDIIVTAQRREQKLLDVPLSITAMSSETLAAQGVRDVSDLQFTTPGLIPNNGAGYVQLFIRGIGNTIFVGADPSVATFIDDVPRIYGSMVNDFINVERVEVLKGAQGGLYGRNATGGVVNILTRQPGDELAAEAQAMYGSYNSFQVAGYVNVPLGDGLAMNVSAQHDRHDGFIGNMLRTNTPYSAANFPTGSYLGTPQQTADFFNSSAKNLPRRIGFKDFWAVEGKLRYETGNFNVTLMADYAKKDDDTGNEYDNIDTETARGLSQFILGTFGIDAVLPPGFYDNGQGKFQTARSQRSSAPIEDYGFSATARLELEGVDLVSITAQRYNNTQYSDDQAGVGPSILDIKVAGKKKYFYQELRAISNNDGPFSYLVGGSYLNTDVSNNSYLIYYPPLFTTTPVTSTGGVKNWSVYAELGYQITDSIHVSASGRYIKETNSVTFSSPVTATTSVSASKFLPAATISYSLPEGGNVYARYAKGFKAGGVNTVDPPTAYPTDLGKTFAPEEVDTFEFGVKTPLGQNGARLSAAIFYNDYKGLQTFTAGNASNPGIVFAIVNAGSAETYGAEVSFDTPLTQSLRLALSAGYLNAKYKDFANTDGTVLNEFDFSGARMLFSPKWQLSGMLNLDKPVDERVDLIGSFLLSYTDDVKFFNSSAPGVPDPIQPAFWMSNARFGVALDDKKYELTVFANNLFNEAYYTSGNAGGFGRQLRWGSPRVIGIEAKVNFF